MHGRHPESDKASRGFVCKRVGSFSRLYRIGLGGSMRRIAGIILAAVVMLAVRQAQAQHPYNWKLENKKDDCETYTSKVSGKPYIAAKAICTIPARLDVLQVVLRDIPNYSKWMADVKETRVVKVVSEPDDVYILWLHQNIPLFRDRDVILKSSVDFDYPKGTVTIQAHSMNGMSYDSGEHLVRMPSLYAEWVLQWIDASHTRATYLIDPDLGGGLPVFISNHIIKNLPYRTMEGMKEMVKEQSFINEAKTSKYEKSIDEAVSKGELKS
jgi:hypothetical protein